MPGTIPPLRGLTGFAFFLLFLLAGGLSSVYAKGKADEAATDPLNKEWVFCVTAFDVSTLPPARKNLGDVLAANLTASLNTVERRVRISPEYAYYEGAALARSRTEAGKKLASKRNERDMLIFKGNPDWKYRRDLRGLDRDILKLEEEYREADAAIPQIEARPVFTLAQSNLEGKFPEAPPIGGEYYFCKAQKADGFLTLKVSEFHGRIYVTLRVYTLYTRSYQYEDSTIFSSEDIVPVMDELGGRISAALAGTSPAAVLVRAEPKDALVLINRNFAGKGDTGVLERTPGPVEVSISAEDHIPITIPLELESGELAEIFIELQPLAREAFVVEVPTSGSNVYQGALYLGKSPFSMSLPGGEAAYINAVTDSGETGGTVIRSGAAGTTVNVPVFMPKGKDEKPVDRARRGFYGAYGRFWIALPLAYMAYGFYQLYRATFLHPESPRTWELYDTASTLYYVSLGSMIVAGGLLGESLFRMVRYIYISGKNQPRTAR